MKTLFRLLIHRAFVVPLIFLTALAAARAEEIQPALAAMKWRYAEIPGFEILSSRPDETTKLYVWGLQRELQLFAHFFPNDFQQAMDVPVRIILYSAEKDVLPGPRYSRPPGSRATPPGALPPGATPAPAQPPPVTPPPVPTAVNPNPASAPRGPTSGNYGSDDRFGGIVQYIDDDALVITRNLWDEEARGRLAVPGPKSLVGGGTPFTVYVGNLLQHRTPPPPAWLAAALRSFFSSASFKSDDIQFSVMRNPRNAAGPITVDSLLPMAEFFALDPTVAARPGPPANAMGMMNIQAQLFGSWAMLADQQSHQAGFSKFAARACVEPVTEALFQECFGMNFDEARIQLGAQLDAPRGANPTLHVDALPEPPTFELRDATTAEFARVTGDAIRMYARLPSRPPGAGGEPAENLRAQARDTLMRGYDAGDRDPRLLAALGLCESDAHDGEKARPFLEAAAKAGVIRPRVYFELATLRRTEALAKPAGAGAKLSPEQVDAVLAPLVTASKQTPQLVKIYALIADTWADSAAKPAKEKFEVIEAGLHFFPRDTDLGFKAAQLYARSGFPVQAGALIERYLALAPKAGVRARFEQLRAELPPTR